MSDILEIYNSIANMTVGGVKAKDVDEVILGIRKTPVRLLLPATQGSMEFVMVGKLQSVDWVIRDLCLFAPVSSGGVGKYGKAMVEYIDLYMAAVKDNRNPYGNSCIHEVEVQMGPMPWGDKDYWAVDITLTVREVL